MAIQHLVPNSEETMELPPEQRTFPCKSINKKIIFERPYPSKTIDVPFGKGLAATQDCPVGTVMEKFDGELVEYSELGLEDIIYVLNVLRDNEWKWVLASTPAIYANHSCMPNSVVNDKQEIVAIRPIKAGEHISFLYNFSATDEDSKWDPLWTFECKCGAKKCQGIVNSYRAWEPLYE